MTTFPYCGAPPLPGALAGRFNLDPVLLVALALSAGVHLVFLRRSRRPVTAAACGWAVTAAALVSPLCALSVSLFSARVAQHMVLLLVAAPLVASALPRARGALAAAAAFTLALWVWHLPAPYAASFASDALYWGMHLTLFGSALWLWAALLHARAEQAGRALLAGVTASIGMGLLGAVLALAPAPLFAPHLLTTAAWGVMPLADQQLGGLLMWVPGLFLFLAVGLRAVAALVRPAGRAQRA